MITTHREKRFSLMLDDVGADEEGGDDLCLVRDRAREMAS